MCLGYDMIDNRLHVLRPFPDGNLSIRAGSFQNNAFDVRDLPLIPELLNFFGEKLQHLVQQIAFFYFFFPTKVDHFCVETITAGPPSIFVY